MAETENKSTLKDKAKKLGVFGLQTLEDTLKARKKQKKQTDAEIQEMVNASASNIQRKFKAVEMGLSPDLEDQGIPMKSATGLITEKYEPSLKGSDASEVKSRAFREFAEFLPESEVGRNMFRLRQRKERVVHGSISRRNPYLFPKPGAAGMESSYPTLLRQIQRQKQPRGSKYDE